MADGRCSLLALGTSSPYFHQLFYHLFKDDQSLLSQAEEELIMACRCQMCGVAGFDELLVYCRKCGTSAEHLYCLPDFPKKGEKVYWICELCEPVSFPKDSLEEIPVDGGGSKVVSLLRLQNNVVSSSHEMVGSESSPCTSLEEGEGRKTKKRRRLILPDEDHIDHMLLSRRADQIVRNKTTELPSKPVLESLAPCTGSRALTNETCVGAIDPPVTRAMIHKQVHDGRALPICDHVWRGCISFGDEKYGPLTAHLSTLACERVCTAAKSLPPLLYMEKLPRLDSIPSSFKSTPPGADKIGLFFFAGCTMVEPVLDQLLADVIQKDLVLRCMLDEVELLMFSSTILPKDHRRFRGKGYLWGGFRRRQSPVISSSAGCHMTSNEAGEENQMMEVSDKNAGGKREGEGRDEESSDSGSFYFSPHSVLQHPKSYEPSEDIQKSSDLSKHENLSKHAQQAKGIETSSLEPQKKEEGKLADDCEKKEERGEEKNVSEDIQKSSDLTKHEDLSKHARQTEGIQASSLEPQKQEEGKLIGDCEQKEEREEEKNVSEDSSQGKFLPLFPLAIGKMTIASERGGGQVKSIGSCHEKFYELEEGEIWEPESEEGEVVKGSEDGHCLSLFPLAGEDLGIASRIESRSELNLDLGLGSPPSGNYGRQSAVSSGHV